MCVCMDVGAETTSLARDVDVICLGRNKGTRLTLICHAHRVSVGDHMKGRENDTMQHRPGSISERWVLRCDAEDTHVMLAT